MENKIRFRNHFSMVLPNLKGLLWIVVMAFVSVFLRDEGEGFKDVLITVLTWILIAVVILVWQIIIWAKTWITIGEQSIVIECNTFFSRRKNTIGIANISNINLEQSLPAMLFGTCKLKLDTNSLSTADTTDVTIVLRKQDAEKLRLLLMSRVSEGESLKYAQEVMCESVNHAEALENEGTGVRKEEVQGLTRGKNKKTHVAIKDILLHGVFASRFLYTIFIPLFILFEFATEMDEADLDYLINEVGSFAADTIGLGLLILIVIIAWSVLSALFSLVRSAVRYWDFQIERQEEKIVIEYGLTRKVNYSIPINKIQAVVVKQTFLARICRRYMVEVVNVGMNDDEKEAQSFLFPYSAKALLKERMELFLPEFADYLELPVQREPRSIWAVWLWPVCVYLLLFVVPTMGAVAEFAPEFMGIAGGIWIVFSAAVLSVKAAGYFTKGIGFGEEVLAVVTGSFSRKWIYMKYEKIQHICLRQSFLAKRFGIVRGEAHLLASMQNQAQEIPYFAEEEIEKVKIRLVRTR